MRVELTEDECRFVLPLVEARMTSLVGSSRGPRLGQLLAVEYSRLERARRKLLPDPLEPARLKHEAEYGQK